MVKEIISPEVSARKIVLHFDDISDKSPEFLELNAGYTFPLVKIRNTTLHYTAILRCELNIGDLFTPTLDLIINDDEKSFSDTDFPMVGDVVTIYLGVSSDKESLPVHMDFDILSIKPTPRGFYITAKTIIKGATKRGYGELYDSGINSFEACKKICGLLGLGLASNMSASSDSDVWLYNGKTRIELLQYILDGMVAPNNGIVHSFIDQHYRLNIIDLSLAFSETPIDEEVRNNIITGKPLGRPEPLVLSNAIVNSPPTTQYRIMEYRPVNNAGIIKRYRPKAVNHIVFEKNYADNTLSAGSSISAIEDTSNGTDHDIFGSGADAKTIDVYKAQTTDNKTHDLYMYAPGHNNLKNNLLNATHIKASLCNISHALYLFKPVKVDIRHSMFRHGIQYSDSDTNSETTNKSPSDLNEEAINKTFSGNYVITSIAFIYNSNNRVSKQILKLHKRLWHRGFLELQQQ